MSTYIDMEKVKAAVVRLGKTSYTEEKPKKGDNTPVDAGRRKTFKSQGDGNPYHLYNRGFGGKGSLCD